MTTNNKKGSALEDYKLEYEATPGDRGQKVPKAVQTSTMRVSVNKEALRPRPKRQGIIKTYIKSMIEVILS